MHLNYYIHVFAESSFSLCTVRDHEDEDLEAEHDAFDNEAEKKMHDVEKTLIDLMLPARTSGIKVMQVSTG